MFHPDERLSTARTPEQHSSDSKQRRGFMTNKVKPIPEGYHTATPYLIVKDAAQAIEFYKKAFGATELMRMPGPGGKIGHAEIKIGDSPIMILLYVEDVDVVFSEALAAGAKVQRPVADQFYGDRTGGVTDPFGHVWYIATHKEDVSPEEMKKRAAAAGR